MIWQEGQAGASANLQIPNGLTVEDLEVAEDMLDEWKGSGDYRAIDVLIKIYEHLRGAAARRQLK